MEFFDDITHIGGKTVEIISEISLDVVGVGQKPFKGILAGVIDALT